MVIKTPDDAEDRQSPMANCDAEDENLSTANFSITTQKISGNELLICGEQDTESTQPGSLNELYVLLLFIEFLNGI